MAVTKTLQQIRRENEVAIKLKKQLEHEMVVLTERKAVSWHGLRKQISHWNNSVHCVKISRVYGSLWFAVMVFVGKDSLNI